MREIALMVLAGVAAAAGCGGDDDGGGADAGPIFDGGPVLEAAEGRFNVVEAVHGEDVFAFGQVGGSILDPPLPVFDTLAMTAGACRLYTFAPGSCDECNGICSAESECVPFPSSLSAGTVTFELPGDDYVIPPQDYGYIPGEAVPEELFSAGDAVTLSAAGAEVGAFELEATGVADISLPLEAGGDEGVDTLRLVDGADLTLTWDAAGGTLVRLVINSSNQSHGLPVAAHIECEVEDTGSLTVPRALIEAFPAKGYESICVGHDCPASTLTRFTRDRAEVGGLTMELKVAFQRTFYVVHEPEN